MIIKLVQEDKKISEEERKLYTGAQKVYQRFKRQMQEFDENASDINEELAKYAVDPKKFMSYKRNTRDVFSDWQEQVQKLCDITAKQEQRMKARSTSTAKGTVQIVSSIVERVSSAANSEATRKAFEKEAADIERIDDVSSRIRKELLDKASQLITYIRQEPPKSSGATSGSWWGSSPGGGRGGGAGGEEPKNPAFEKDFAQLFTDKEDPIRSGLAAAALACRSASPTHVYTALERVKGVDMPNWAANAQEGDFLRLKESSVNDLVLCLKTYGTVNSDIAELAWQCCWGALEGDDDENLDQEIAKWSRAGYLALAAEGLFHMMLPQNQSSWGDSIDDLCTAIGRLTQSTTTAQELLITYPVRYTLRPLPFACGCAAGRLPLTAYWSHAPPSPFNRCLSSPLLKCSKSTGRTPTFTGGQ